MGRRALWWGIPAGRAMECCGARGDGWRASAGRGAPTIAAVNHANRPFGLLSSSLAVLAFVGCRHDTGTAEPEVVTPRFAATEPAASEPAVAEPAAPEPAAPEPAAVEPVPVAEPVEAPPEVPPAVGPRPLVDLPGATITMGEVSADGLRVAELACVVDSMPMFGALVIVASLAKQDRALDRCAPRGDAAIASWSFANGRAKDVVVTGGGSPKIDACLTAALRKAAGPFDARCSAVLLVGAAAGADAGLQRLRAAGG